MEETEKRWGIAIQRYKKSVLLGANLNTGSYAYDDDDEDDWYGYICIYLFFCVLVIGYDYFPKRGEKNVNM